MNEYIKIDSIGERVLMGKITDQPTETYKRFINSRENSTTNIRIKKRINKQKYYNLLSLNDSLDSNIGGASLLDKTEKLVDVANKLKLSDIYKPQNENEEQKIKDDNMKLHKLYNHNIDGLYKVSLANTSQTNNIDRFSITGDKYTPKLEIPCFDYVDNNNLPNINNYVKMREVIQLTTAASTLNFNTFQQYTNTIPAFSNYPDPLQYSPNKYVIVAKSILKLSGGSGPDNTPNKTELDFAIDKKKYDNLYTHIEQQEKLMKTYASYIEYKKFEQTLAINAKIAGINVPQYFSFTNIREIKTSNYVNHLPDVVNIIRKVVSNIQSTNKGSVDLSTIGNNISHFLQVIYFLVDKFPPNP